MQADAANKRNACVVIVVVVVFVVVGDYLNALPVRVDYKHFHLNYVIQTVNASAHAADNSA